MTGSQPSRHSSNADDLAGCDGLCVLDPSAPVAVNPTFRQALVVVRSAPDREREDQRIRSCGTRPPRHQAFSGHPPSLASGAISGPQQHANREVQVPVPWHVSRPQLPDCALRCHGPSVKCCRRWLLALAAGWEPPKSAGSIYMNVSKLGPVAAILNEPGRAETRVSQSRDPADFGASRPKRNGRHSGPGPGQSRCAGPD